VRPTDRVGVVGIGGLGHMALQFLHHWGCEVVAFTSTAAKHDEARAFGAHHTVDSRDSAAIAQLAGSLDFLLVTVNVPLDRPGGPSGRVLEEMPRCLQCPVGRLEEG
jgi:uncharacterized zinc-type alcohol dehydrogenase-like protein